MPLTRRRFARLAAGFRCDDYAPGGRGGRAITFVLGLALTVSLIGSPPGADAAGAVQQSEEAQAAKRKINLAGRQRMLSQRAAMLSCLSDSGVLPETTLQAAGLVVNLFDRTLIGLRDGDGDLGLVAEQDSGIRASLGEVEVVWETYRDALNRFAASRSDMALSRVHQLNTGVLTAMNNSVMMMEDVYGQGLVSEELATTLNTAGRQRMLLMKVMKEACMIGRNIDPEADQRALAQSHWDFEASLYMLRNGHELQGIIAPPSFEIEMQMELALLIWEWMSPHLKAIAAGEQVDEPLLTALYYHAEVALAELNRAVSMYEKF